MVETTSIYDIEEDREEQLKQSYQRNQAIRERYEASPSYDEDLVKEQAASQFNEAAEQELKQIDEGEDPSFFDHLGSFAKHIGVGVAKGFEETGQTLRLIDDNAWNLPEPETLAGSLGQGLGQFLPLFLGGSWAIRGGLKLTNLFQKSGALNKAGQALTAVGAGALSDVVAFDPKDKNLGNLALTIGAISENPRAAAAVKRYLAQQDEDSEAKARAKNAVTGLVAGAVAEGLLRGAGWALKKTGVIKPKVKKPTLEESETNIYGDEDFGEQIDEILPSATKDTALDEKAIKDASLDFARDFTRVLDDIKQQPGSKETLEKELKELPTEEEAIVGQTRKNEKDYKEKWDKNEEEYNSGKQKEDFNDDVKEFIYRVANGGKIEPQDLTIIESTNLLKIDNKTDAKYALQFIAKKLDVKRLQKPTVKTEDFETVIYDLLDGSVTEVHEDQIQAVLKAATNVDEAIQYVGSAKVLAAIGYKRVIQAAKQDIKVGTKESEKVYYESQLALQEILRAGGLLSKKSSDLLRSYAKQVRALDNEDLLKAELLEKLTRSTRSLKGKTRGREIKLNQLDELTAKVHFEELKRTKKTTVKRTETPTGKRITRKIERLQRALASLKRPERGEPLPKQRPLKDTPEIIALKAQIKKVKLERDTLENKFKREAKEQLAIRKEARNLSEDIENLRKGLKPQRKGKTLKPNEIAQLKAEKAKELKKLNSRLDEGTKAQKRLDALNNQYSKLLMQRAGLKDISPITKIERTEAEKVLQSMIKKETASIKEKVTRQELEETLIAKSSKEIQAEIASMNLMQLKTRVKSMNKSLIAKGGSALTEIYINGLLSSVKTIGQVNPLGNTSALITSVIERAFAGATGNQIAMRESAILAWNAISGIPEFFKTIVSSYKFGPKDLDVKFDFVKPHERAISSHAFNLGGNLGKAVDYVGSVVNMPGRLLLATDEAFKGLSFRGEQRALAYRKARNKFSTLDLKAPDAKFKIQKEYDDILRNLDKHEDITEAARNTAAKNTFTNPLPEKIQVDPRTGREKVVPGFSKSIQGVIDRNGWMRIFVPFFQTPVNILNFTWERTPLIQFANKAIRDELRSPDPAIKQLAIAKIGTSMTMWGGMFSLAMTGNFTGSPPRDPNLRKTMEAEMGGTHWHSFNAGDGWRKYDRLDPYGVMMAGAANLATMAKSMLELNGKFEEEGDPTGEISEKYNEVFKAGVIGTLELVKDRHYLQGFSELVDFFSGDERKLTPSIKRALTFADPRIGFYSSFRRGIATGLRPEKQIKLQRGVEKEEEVGKLTLKTISEEISLAYDEAMKAVTPGYGDNLAQKNLVGETVFAPGTNNEFSLMSNLANSMANPVPKLKGSKSPLIQKLAQLESKVAQPSGIKKLGNVVLTNSEKSFIIDRWTELNKRILEPFVTSNNFTKLPEGLQLLALENLIRANRKAAHKLALVEFPRLSQGYVDYKINSIQRKVAPERATGFQPLLNLGQQ